MVLELDYRWRLSDPAGQGPEPALFVLLEAVAATGSLRQAAQAVGLSYRHAWGMVGRWSQALGQPLLNLERGRGASLAPMGSKLLEIEQRARTRLGPHLAALAREASQALAELLPSGVQGLRIEASHDLALEGLRRLAARGPQLDLQFRGSLEALDAFAAGRCDLAGFHVPEDDIAARLAPQFRRVLREGPVRLIRVADRVQGIMVRNADARRIRTLRDLARTGVRFVNRQRGSGTRLLLDLLLADKGIAPDSIAGYESEEFTHAAVAATVVSGMADAGFGVKAAASQARLAFIPIAREHYFLACREALLRTEPGRALVRLLMGRGFRNLVAKLPGYDASRSGRIEDVSAALPWL
ncbi:MAG TPA: substrate-binding domain-containing protein [Burkholderiales bacterium]|nr:substrate-binding domain-containing protein [Burkholderiales bacterium]